MILGGEVQIRKTSFLLFLKSKNIENDIDKQINFIIFNSRHFLSVKRVGSLIIFNCFCIISTFGYFEKFFLHHTNIILFFLIDILLSDY